MSTLIARAIALSAVAMETRGVAPPRRAASQWRGGVVAGQDYPHYLRSVFLLLERPIFRIPPSFVGTEYVAVSNVRTRFHLLLELRTLVQGLINLPSSLTFTFLSFSINVKRMKY